MGASLEARVLLWVESPALAQAIQRLDSADNGVDPLRYLFITSQARPNKRLQLIQGWQGFWLVSSMLLAVQLCLAGWQAL